MPTSDGELLQRWGEGDARAGDRLFRRHAPAIVRYFRNKVSADLEDLVQQTFLRGLEARARFRNHSSFGGYLFGIAWRVLADYYRTKYRTPAARGLTEVSLHDLSPSPSVALAERCEHRLLLLGLCQIPIVYQTPKHGWRSPSRTPRPCRRMPGCSPT